MDLTELIKKQEQQSKALLDVISHPNIDSLEKEKALVARRFVTGFIYDLKKVNNKL